MRISLSSSAAELLARGAVAPAMPVLEIQPMGTATDTPSNQQAIVDDARAYQVLADLQKMGVALAIHRALDDSLANPAPSGREDMTSIRTQQALASYKI